MGAQQSSNQQKPSQQGDAGGPHVKTCYYELLGVDRQASDDEIKKAYRRKALELHPDRNYGDVEDSTRLFAEVQSAHQILSDPQERAWYDSHRDAILRDSDIGAGDHFEHDMRFTSATDLTILMGKFSPNMPFTNSLDGFYGRLQSVFEALTKEEDAACNWEGLDPIDYPDFGAAESSYDHVVKPFYVAWASFSTRKSFSWKDVHNYADAPDRRVRRLMEKENKRLRDEGIREFNDAVRSLVGFVRKRDPRYIPNTQSEADRQQALRDAAAAQAARSRAMREAKLNEHVQPAWAQTRYAEEEGTFSDSEASEEEVVECVTCNKIFKSEKQYEVHEKSKKHIKAVRELTRQMRKENKLFHLDTPVDAALQSIPENSDSEASFHSLQDATDDDIIPVVGIDKADPEIGAGNDDLTGSDPSPKENEADRGPIEESTTPAIPEDGTDDDDYAPREQVEDRISGLPNQERPKTDGYIKPNVVGNETRALDNILISSDRGTDEPPTEENKKLGKAKAKRAKKAARQQAEDDTQNNTCATCNSSFSSKNKLFDHIKAEKHGLLVPKPKTGGRRKTSH
ncbi:hypothetical protein VC83_04633 [Pseudogymnoascus destructans]|uniref:J domain-containing protein n=2 Tax=Pseudogymnoascus destructans TaxID=655981 RepID=L8G8K1_PSED2|nr:uncharacterized protein VC83_04633 [Pseudogymnoascus destructans]ELR08356.1 hypothetical protein GMDG_03151 [Pseudogymnoascus destructans 20631-21]OAF57384.1 hypothetical protein VC83_04633 [Pseudogymnoascus destructans]